MKNPAFILIAFAFIATSCDDDCVSGSGPIVSREIELDEFNSFTLQGSAEVEVRRGDIQEVIVEGQDNILNQINTDIRGGHWDVFTEGCIRNHRGLKIYITVPELKMIGLTGSGSVETYDTFEGDEMSVVLSGSGRLEVVVTTAELYTTITGSGKVEVDGYAELADLNITGSGTYEGFGLETSSTHVDISGSGDAKVSVNDLLQVRITGSGNVYYRGNPAVETDITGSGEVKKD